MENRIGFGKRLGAILLDCLIVGTGSFFLGSTIGGLLGVAAGGIAGAGGGGEESAATGAAIGGAIGAALGFVAAMALIWVIYFLMEGFTGFTLGKLILGIRIANQDGTQAAAGTLLGRYAIKNVGSLTSVAALLVGINLLATLGNVAGLVVFVGCFLALGAKKQALHDQIMKTAVYPKEFVKAA